MAEEFIVGASSTKYFTCISATLNASKWSSWRLDNKLLVTTPLPAVQKLLEMIPGALMTKRNEKDKVSELNAIKIDQIQEFTNSNMIELI